VSSSTHSSSLAGCSQLLPAPPSLSIPITPACHHDFFVLPRMQFRSSTRSPLLPVTYSSPSTRLPSPLRKSIPTNNKQASKQAPNTTTCSYCLLALALARAFCILPDGFCLYPKPKRSHPARCDGSLCRCPTVLCRDSNGVASPASQWPPLFACVVCMSSLAQIRSIDRPHFALLSRLLQYRCHVPATNDSYASFSCSVLGSFSGFVR